MSRVNFSHAFDRWYKLTEVEQRRMVEERGRGGVNLSWEALDHLCGLAVESGMKALMFQAKMAYPDASGDYPADTSGRRPHVDKLWDIFMAKRGGRTMDDWVGKLGKGGAAPANVFREWRAEHRYAPDGTVSEAVVLSRLEIAKRLRRIAQEEGL